MKQNVMIQFEDGTYLSVKANTATGDFEALHVTDPAEARVFDRRNGMAEPRRMAAYLNAKIIPVPTDYAAPFADGDDCATIEEQARAERAWAEAQEWTAEQVHQFAEMAAEEEAKNAEEARNTFQFEDGRIAHKYRLLGTNCWVYRAYEPTTITGEHSSLTSFEGRFRHERGLFYGAIQTREMPEPMRSLPALSKERSDAWKSWYFARCSYAYETILDAFPEAAHGLKSDGVIDLDLEL